MAVSGLNVSSSKLAMAIARGYTIDTKYMNGSARRAMLAGFPPVRIIMTNRTDRLTEKNVSDIPSLTLKPVHFARACIAFGSKYNAI